MAIEQQLEKIGLSDKEAKTYLALLELGPTTVVNVAKKSGLKRTTTYEILKTLLARGLVNEIVFGKRRRFVAESPAKFLEHKKDEVEKLREMLPTLEALHNVAIERPSVQFFEGKEALKQIFTDMISNTSPVNDKIRGIETKGNTKILLGHFGEQFWISLLRKKKERGLQSFILDTIGKKEYLEFQEKYPWVVDHNLITRYLSDLDDLFTVNIYLYQNKLAIVAADQLIAFVVENFRLKQSFDFIFETLWKSKA
jgi:HTH-type transcriptional regulator, sugar sensing transcriptional regulator